MRQHNYSLIREFSRIGCLQKAHTISYAYYADENRTWLELEKNEEGQSRKEQLTLDCCSWQAAQELVQYLYENAVPMENWKDIAADTRICD